VNKIL